MKLLFCSRCTDIFNLTYEIKSCTCGSVEGRYLDELNAIYKGDTAVPLGFTNDSFCNAIKEQPVKGMGREFVSFIIPKSCPTFKKM